MSEQSLFSTPGPKKSTDPPEVTYYSALGEKLEPDKTTKMSSEELEDEVLEAVEEAKEEEKDDAYRCVAEGAEHIRAVMDSEPEPEPVPVKKQVIPPNTIKRLRLRDRHFNKTCANCARRVPLAEIENGKGEVCDTCRG